jgi:hypothetical protein|tara:strand:+ start:1804 stop:2760 length:957 start_codon:yes stop_codon:yes gene_type:complete
MKQKYIVGLGCSWTQGEGGYPKEVVDAHNGRTQIRPGQEGFPDTDYYLRVHELENSWVNQLCKYHFPEYTPLNLGVKGMGNTGAVSQLHFANQHDFENAEGIVILMMSGMERLDVLQERPMDNWGYEEPDGYNVGDYRHEKFHTAWPLDSDDRLFWTAYARELWSEQFVAGHTMLALLNLQTWAKAHNFKIVVANAFNQREEKNDDNTVKWDGVLPYLKENAGSLHDQFDWSCYFHNDDVDYGAFLEELVSLDGLMPKKNWVGYNTIYNPENLDTHSEYLTNDNGAHPTIKGYRFIADELAKFITKRGYIEKSQFCKP